MHRFIEVTPKVMLNCKKCLLQERALYTAIILTTSPDLSNHNFDNKVLMIEAKKLSLHFIRENYIKMLPRSHGLISMFSRIMI